MFKRLVLWALGINHPIIQHLQIIERRLSALEDDHAVYEEHMDRLKARMNEFTGVNQEKAPH